jgi:hypothetical protein
MGSRTKSDRAQRGGEARSDLLKHKTARDSIVYPFNDRVDAQVSLKWVKERR